MTMISKRELNQQTAAVLERVTDAADVIVTERGVPRWRVSAVREPDSVLRRLEREGRYSPPSREPASWPTAPGGLAYTSDEAAALLDEMRGEH